MGRTPCCGDHQGQRRGPWTPEEDQKLINYLQRHGLSNWRTLPKLAGLSRCGKSCRLRWTNYLRPDIKRGTFTIEEDLALIRLHAILGNKWSAIASHFPGRTDNEIKNRWNTKLKKQLLLMGIDPVTHRSLLPTPPYMHSFLASSSTVESTMAAGCNTALVESELRRLSRDDVNNISHVSPGSWNLLAMIKNTVETPVGACPSSEILLPLPYISMDQLLWPRTSRWPHGFHEALQLSNMERKSEGMANINSYGIPSNLKNEMDAFLDDLLSGEETEIMYDDSRHSEISASFENGIHYHTDRAAIPAARADLLNKVDEIDYSVNFLNTYDGMEELNQIIDARPA